MSVVWHHISKEAQNSWSTRQPDPQIGRIRAPSETAVHGGETRLRILSSSNPKPLSVPHSSHIERNAKKSNFTMEELEQWKEQLSHFANLALDRLLEVPPNQLYAAAAIVIFTTLLLLSSEFAVRFIVEF